MPDENSSGHNFLTFGGALQELRKGEKVSRFNWNGKGMFIYLVGAAEYPAQTDVAKAEFGDTVPYREYIAFKTVDDEVVPWVASQTDLLANDWEVVA